MKTNIHWLCFIAANLVFLVALVVNILPPRLDTLRMLEADIQMRQRQLAIMEQNLLMYNENVELLAYLQDEGIPSVGQMGYMLTEMRSLFSSHGLQEQDFYAREHASHQAGGRRVVQTRGTIMGEGLYDNATLFLQALSEHDIYYRLERIQITHPADAGLLAGHVQLWLNFSIYEIY